MKQSCNPPTQQTQNVAARPSTYSLLVRSEEKSRSLFEAAIYLLCVISAVASIWQFANQAVALPGITRLASVSAPVNAPLRS